MVGKTTDGSDLADQVKAIQDELMALTETIRSFTSQKASAGADALRDAAHLAGDTMRSTAEEARRHGEHIADDIEGRISDNPVPSVLIAAGIGFVLGALIGRR